MGPCEIFEASRIYLVAFLQFDEKVLLLEINSATLSFR